MALHSAPKPITYKVELDASGTQAEAARAERALKGIEDRAQGLGRALGDVNLDVDIDTSAVDTLRRRLIEKKRSIERDVQVDMDIDPAKALMQLRAIERQIKSLDRMTVRPEVKVDVDRGGISRMSGLIELAASQAGRLGAAFAALPPQAQLAVGAVAVFTAALATPVVAGTVGGLVAGVGAKAGVELLGAFDAIEKQTRRASIVFGSNLADVEKWAAGVSYNVGQGTQDVVAAAAGIQDLLVPQGFTRGKAADITKSVYERGAAIAEFAGRDTTEGIDAVTKALLGQTKSLQSMGVQIKKADVTAWLKANADQVVGLNDKQKQTVATLALIEAGSKDAWTAYEQGAGTADDVLDTLGATFANVKTELLKGFGGIFVGVLEDILKVSGGFDSMKDASKSVADWIEANADRIRAAMLTVADFVLAGAESFLQFGRMALVAFRDSAPAISGWLRMMGNAASILQATAGAALVLNPATRSLGINMIKGSKATADLANSAADALTAFAGFADDGIAGLDLAIEKVTGLRGVLAEVERADAIRVAIETTLNDDGMKAAKRDIKALSLEEIDLLAKVGVDDKDLQRFIEKRRNEQIDIKVKAILAAEFGDYGSLPPIAQDLFRKRQAELTSSLRVNIDADTSGVTGALEGLPKTQDIDVNVAAPNLDGVKADLNGLQTPRTVPVTATTTGFAPINKQLAGMERPRTAPVEVTDKGSAANVSGLITLAARRRDAWIDVKVAGWANANAWLNDLARTRTARINVVSTGGGGGSEEDGASLLAGAAAGRSLQYAMGRSDVGRYAVGGNGQSYRVAGGTLQPSERQPGTQVIVNLDGRTIARYLEPAVTRKRSA